MAYSNTLNYVVGDTLPELTFKLKDKNTAASGAVLDEEDSSTWAPISISGSSVKLRIRQVGGTTLAATLTCSITDAANGTCATDLSLSGGGSVFTASGVYEGEVEITFSGGGKQTVNDLLKFKVRDDFD